MAWSASKIFMCFLENALENTNAVDLDTDTIKVTLWDDGITPSQTVATASAVFGSGVWTTSGTPGVEEWYDGTEWDTGGEPLTGVSSSFSSNVYTFTGANTPSGGTSATLTGVTGCALFDSSVANNGICYNYFGGSNSVTDGTFTILWNGSGIFTITA